ncbi:hypothetical protein HEP81_08119 (plasmid) [Streptomyces griseofuscus]|uniref:Uncharacterized protein n=1 Tax=Streptomyces griseofuscus TaxID=146922 RepID=A0A7H1QDG7_9ACTN|nr:hypothetical protein HEP81_08119 [Streptomyces griseofuscus]
MVETWPSAGARRAERPFHGPLRVRRRGSPHGHESKVLAVRRQRVAGGWVGRSTAVACFAVRAVLGHGVADDAFASGSSVGCLVLRASTPYGVQVGCERGRDQFVFVAASVEAARGGSTRKLRAPARPPDAAVPLVAFDSYARVGPCSPDGLHDSGYQGDPGVSDVSALTSPEALRPENVRRTMEGRPRPVAAVLRAARRQKGFRPGAGWASGLAALDYADGRRKSTRRRRLQRQPLFGHGPRRHRRRTGRGRPAAAGAQKRLRGLAAESAAE